MNGTLDSLTLYVVVLGAIVVGFSALTNYNLAVHVPEWLQVPSELALTVSGVYQLARQRFV